MPAAVVFSIVVNSFLAMRAIACDFIFEKFNHMTALLAFYIKMASGPHSWVLLPVHFLMVQVPGRIYVPFRPLRLCSFIKVTVRHRFQIRSVLFMGFEQIKCGYKLFNLHLTESRILKLITHIFRIR